VREDSSFYLCSPGNAVTLPTVSVLLESGTSSVLVNVQGKWEDWYWIPVQNISILQPGVSRNQVNVTNLKPYGVTGEALNIKGLYSVSFELDSSKFRHRFWYVSSLQIWQAC